MKNVNLKFFSNLLLLALLPLSLSAQYSKTYKKSLDAKQELEIMHRRGALKVLPSKDGKVSYEMLVKIEAKSEEAANQMFNAISISDDTFGDRLTLTTATEIKSMMVNNRKSTIKLRDGTKIQGVRSIEIDMIVYTPKVQKLEVDHKYKQVSIESNLTKDLELKLYSCRMQVGSVPGALAIECKYTKGNMGTVGGDAQLDLYDSDIKFNTLGNVRLESKYGELIFGDVKDLRAKTYDDKIELKNINGIFILDDKYSQLRLASAGECEFDIYDSEVKINKTGNLKIKSKYTEYDLGEVGAVNFVESYDDVVDIESAKSLETYSKYTDYEIDLLHNKLEIESYDDNFVIGKVGPNFEGAEFDGKYAELRIDSDNELKYRLEIDARYGKVDLEEEAFEFQIYKEANSELYAKGKSKGATDSSPLILMKGYNNKIRIR
ncbi:MAG: hypothetical protein AAFO07_20645 [Bacteroidota bacterium]